MFLDGEIILIHGARPRQVGKTTLCKQILEKYSLTKRVRQFFYRTFTGEEVDYVEEYNSIIEGYEFKYSKDKIKQPKNFISNYDPADVKCINKEN